MNSILARAPGSSLLIVGTFVDKLKNKNQSLIEISEEINRTLNKWEQSIPATKKLQIDQFK